MPGIGVITNLKSFRNKNGAYTGDRMGTILGPHGICRDTGDLSEIPGVLREFRDRGVEIICINGGDGTQHHVANGVLTVFGERGPYPILVPFRGGVMNMLAKNFIPRGTPDRSLEAVRGVYRAAKDAPGGRLPVHPCATLRVECPSIDLRGVGFVYGTGIIHRALSRYYGEGPPGFRNAVSVVTSTLSGFVLGSRAARSAIEHVEARIAVDGRSLPFRRILVAVASVIPDLILWFRPFPRRPGPPGGRGFYFLALDMNNWEVIRRAWALSRGTLPPHDKVFNGTAESVVIDTPCGFTLDGEVFTPPGDARITLTPGPTFDFLSLPGGMIH